MPMPMLLRLRGIGWQSNTIVLIILESTKASLDAVTTKIHTQSLLDCSTGPNLFDRSKYKHSVYSGDKAHFFACFLDLLEGVIVGNCTLYNDLLCGEIYRIGRNT